MTTLDSTIERVENGLRGRYYIKGQNTWTIEEGMKDYKSTRC